MKRKQKILFVITKSNLGGAQRYVLELATKLPREHFEVVVAFGGNGLLKTKLEEAHIRTHTIKSFERDINIRKELQSVRELYQLIQQEKPDVVHLNSSKAGGSGALIARLCSVKNIIFTAHGWPFYEQRSLAWRGIVWFLSYLTTLLAHHVIVVSQHDYDGAHMPLLTHKLTLIHTALPSIQFETQDDARATLFSSEIIERHKHDIWLVSTGEHTQNKNLAVLISALKKFKRDGRTNIFLTLMSDGELRTELSEIVEREKLEDQVFFTGFIPEARTYLKAFDIFLMPSRKEGFPYGLLEAGAAGLPVIASRVGGIPELITHEHSGLLINPDNETTLIDALVALLDSTSLRTHLGETLRTRVQEEFALTTMIERTRVVYEENGSRAS